MEKAAISVMDDNTTVVMLLPARTDTKWYHKWIANNPRAHTVFLQGRLRFGGSKTNAPFPSMITVFAYELGTNNPFALKEAEDATIELKGHGYHAEVKVSSDALPTMPDMHRVKLIDTLRQGGYEVLDREWYDKPSGYGGHDIKISWEEK